MLGGYEKRGVVSLQFCKGEGAGGWQVNVLCCGELLPLAREEAQAGVAHGIHLAGDGEADDAVAVDGKQFEFGTRE